MLRSAAYLKHFSFFLVSPYKQLVVATYVRSSTAGLTPFPMFPKRPLGWLCHTTGAV